MPSKTVALPSKIKTLYVELPAYEFHHGASSTFPYFMGREKVKRRLCNLLAGNAGGSGGAYLLAGYRGMGKSLLVDKVIDEINEAEYKSRETDEAQSPLLIKYIKIHISLSQDDVRDFDIMKFFATQLYREWEEISPLIIPKFLANSPISAKPVLTIDKRLSWLNHRLNSVIKTQYSQNLKSGKNDADNLSATNAKEIVVTEALAKEIEKELIYILDQYHQIRKLTDGLKDPKYKLPDFIFIIDELDKIEPSHLHDFGSAAKDSPTQSDTDNIFGINKVRRRQELIARILANLKSFLNTAKAKFIFIGGREMYDAALADIADRDSFYSSIFHDVLYVNSFFKDQVTASHSGITRLTEALLCKMLIPDDYYVKYKPAFTNTEHPDTNYNLTTYFHYLCDCCIRDVSDNLLKEEYNEFGEDRYHRAYEYVCKLSEKGELDSEQMQKLHKTIFFLQNLVVFLTFRSNGTPKKLIALIESFIVNLENTEAADIKAKGDIIWFSFPEGDDKTLSVSQVKGDSFQTTPVNKNKKTYFLRFSFNQQYEIGLTATIYRPYILIHSRHLKALGDKLLYSASYIIDYILKYHPHAFSWRTLELIPEIILVNKDPNLRYFIADIVKYLSGIYIRETTNGMFMYRFYNKQANEIQLLSKVSESASAAFNFTLDESLHIIRYYRRKLEQLKKAHPNYNKEYIHSIGFIQGILGDLYYYEREYDEAIVYYTNAVQVLRAMAQREPNKMTKHQVVLYVRNKLLLGLCLEKIKAFDSAYSIYRGLILNIPQLLDQVILGNTQQGTALASGWMDDEWDKPIRRMQLFIKPHIALLDLIEKQRMDGITYANLSRNFKDVYDFLVGRESEKNAGIMIGKGVVSKKKMDNMRVSLLLSDYYANVGSFLFFKNRNFPELFDLLKQFNMVDAHSEGMHTFLNKQRSESHSVYIPSLSAFAYYYTAIQELLGSYTPQIIQIIPKAKEEKNELIRAIYLLHVECDAIINNTNLFNFGNLFAKIGDTLLSSITDKHLEISPLSQNIIDLFSSDENNETHTTNKKIVEGIIELMNQFYQVNNCQVTCSLNINVMLLYYRIAGLFYLKAGKTYSYAFQYKKALFVLKDYLMIRKTSFTVIGKDRRKKEETVSASGSLEILPLDITSLEVACEKIAVRVINSATWLSDVSNRPQILKYREILKFDGKAFSPEETRRIYLGLTTSSEIREVIALTEEIKIKLQKIKSELAGYTPRPVTSYVTAFDLINSRFSRVLDLRFQSVFNFYKLQDKKFDTLLKSPVLVDLQSLEELKEAEINKIREKLKKSEDLDSLKIDFGNKHPLANKFFNAIDYFNSKMKFFASKTPSQERNNEFIERYFPELLEQEELKKLGNIILKDEEIKILICDSIFALFEVIKTLNLYGVNYISNYSFLANMHFKLANWCEIAANYEFLQSFCGKSSDNNIRNLIKASLGEDDIHYIEANYHNELAIQYYYSALQTHSEGNAYKNQNQKMSFLEDDFNDNLSHFSAASERFRINTGLIPKKIEELRLKVKYSNIYSYKNYTDSFSVE